MHGRRRGHFRRSEIVKRKHLLRHLQAASALFGVGAISSGVHASALSDLAAQMNPGEWRELVTSNFSGMTLPNTAGDGSSPFIEFTDEAQRNPLTKRIYILGCARGVSDPAYECSGSSAPDSGYVMYDENTNAWQRLSGSPVLAAPHAYDDAAMNPANGDYYFWESIQLTNHKVWKLSGGTWTNLPVPSNVYSGFGALEFFPEMNALLFVDGGDGFPAKVMILPTGASSWQSVNVGAPIGTFSNFSEYDPNHHLMYFGGGNNSDHVLMKMDAQRNITRGADAPVSLGVFGTGGRETIDPVTGNLLALSAGTPGTGKVYSYNPVNNQWTEHGTHPLGTSGGQVIAVLVPVPEAGVVFAVNYQQGGSKVYLYRHSAGTGTPVPSASVPNPPTALAAQ
jgi:hypothetical protein